MKKYSMKAILSAIRQDFTDTYKNAISFTDTPLFYQCMGIICNVCDLEEIIAENDRGTPPVQTLCGLFEKHCCQIENLTDFDDICMGELMAFLFKHILGYQNQKDDVPVQNNLEIKTAAVYFDREEFLIEG